MLIKERQELDFYKDFYNLLTPDEVDDFYAIDEEQEYIELKPADFFLKFYNTYSNSLELVIYEFLIKNRILTALNRIYDQWYIDWLSFDEEVNKYEFSYYLFKTVDEWGLFNIEWVSTESVFDNAITVEDYEAIILNQINNEVN